MTLRTFHTGTHVDFAACRKVLGPHIWQNGAKKTTQNAHLDITHFTSISKEEEFTSSVAIRPFTFISVAQNPTP